MEEKPEGKALITFFQTRLPRHSEATTGRNPAERDPNLVDIALPIRRNAPAFLYRA